MRASRQLEPRGLSGTTVGAPAAWRKFLVDVYYIWLEQMLEVRAAWGFYAVFALLMPLTMVFGFGRMGSAGSDSAGLLYIISGSAVFSVANEGIAGLAQRVGEMKRDGTLLYYAALPISKAAFILALICSRLVVTLPGMLVALLAGAWLYGIDLAGGPWMLVVLPLTGMALASIGMAVGALMKSFDMIVATTNLLLVVLLMAAPVFIPIEALPWPLRWLGYALPPTYAADAMRLALGGTISTRFYFDIGMLLAMTIGSLATLGRWLRWRID